MTLLALLNTEIGNEQTAATAVSDRATAQANVIKYQALVTLVQGVKTLQDSTIAQLSAALAQTKAAATAALNASSFAGLAGTATLTEAGLAKINVKDADLNTVVTTTKMTLPLDITKTVVDYRTLKSGNDADLVTKKLDAQAKRITTDAARATVDQQVAALLDKVGNWSRQLGVGTALVGDVGAKLTGQDLGGAWESLTMAEAVLNVLASLTLPDTTPLTNACDSWATAEDASITADGLYQDALTRQITDASNLALAEAQVAVALTAYVKSKS